MNKFEYNHILSEIGLTISRRTAQFPITIRELGNQFGLNPRSIKQAIHKLRESGLPIGANRSRPYGYWWISTEDEMKTFVQQYRAQAIQELSIVKKMLKLHYPRLTGQLPLFQPPLDDRQIEDAEPHQE